MNKALFLDRDGVINDDVSYLYKPEDFRFREGIFALCRQAQRKGYLPIIATNQSGIARGYYTEEDFHRLTDWMLARFRDQGVHIARVYFCPFHPEKGQGRYRVDSPDRKPHPGMFLQAQRDFDIDMAASVAIGDRDSDTEAARGAGVGTLLLMPEKYECSPAADVRVIRTLSEAEAYL